MPLEVQAALKQVVAHLATIKKNNNLQISEDELTDIKESIKEFEQELELLVKSLDSFDIETEDLYNIRIKLLRLSCIIANTADTLSHFISKMSIKERIESFKKKQFGLTSKIKLKFDQSSHEEAVYRISNIDEKLVLSGLAERCVILNGEFEIEKDLLFAGLALSIPFFKFDKSEIIYFSEYREIFIHINLKTFEQKLYKSPIHDFYPDKLYFWYDEHVIFFDYWKNNFICINTITNQIEPISDSFVKSNYATFYDFYNELYKAKTDRFDTVFQVYPHEMQAIVGNSSNKSLFLMRYGMNDFLNFPFLDPTIIRYDVFEGCDEPLFIYQADNIISIYKKDQLIINYGIITEEYSIISDVKIFRRNNDIFLAILTDYDTYTVFEIFLIEPFLLD